MSHRSYSNQRRTLPYENKQYQAAGVRNSFSQQPKIHPEHVTYRNQPITRQQAAPSIDRHAASGSSHRKYGHIGFKEERNSFSDDSNARTLPYVVFERSQPLNRQLQHRSVSEEDVRYSLTHYELDDIKSINEDDECIDRIYHEIDAPQQMTRENTQLQPAIRMLQTNNLDRPQSSMNSSIANTVVVHGCGGKCQTVESVCYFFLRLMLTMAFLIGVLLCVTGYAVKRSATRDVQVLIYIGCLLMFVSGLLLYVQYKAKNKALQRIRKIQKARRKIIPMETLNVRTNPMHNVNNEKLQANQRLSQLPQVQIHPANSLPNNPSSSSQVDRQVNLDHSGVPWWRSHNV